MNDTLTVNTVRFVEATEIIPADWGSWFWAALSESSSVTFGDNEYSLICPERFKEEMLEILDMVDEDSVDTNELKKIEEVLTALAQEGILINL
jgi:hypothetical protein